MNQYRSSEMMQTMAAPNGTIKTPINLDFMSDEELDRYLRAEENKDSIFEINGKLYTISTHTVSEDGNVTTKLKRVKTPRIEEPLTQHNSSNKSLSKPRASAGTTPSSSSANQQDEEFAKLVLSISLLFNSLYVALADCLSYSCRKAHIQHGNYFCYLLFYSANLVSVLLSVSNYT